MNQGKPGKNGPKTGVVNLFGEPADEVPTKTKEIRGYPFGEVASALQKEIRRGDERAAECLRPKVLTLLAVIEALRKAIEPLLTIDQVDDEGFTTAAWNRAYIDARTALALVSGSRDA